jgi:putative spermidine/putrescine transport system substrate-binding protein
LLAEAGKKKGRLDVIAMSVTQLPVMMGLKALAKIDDLPGYDDAVHQIQNVDTQGYAVAFWGNQTGFAYDPKQIGNQALPQTLDQLQSFINANPRGSAITTQITVARGSFYPENRHHYGR